MLTATCCWSFVPVAARTCTGLAGRTGRRSRDGETGAGAEGGRGLERREWCAETRLLEVPFCGRRTGIVRFVYQGGSVVLLWEGINKSQTIVI